MFHVWWPLLHLLVPRSFVASSVASACRSEHSWPCLPALTRPGVLWCAFLTAAGPAETRQNVTISPTSPNFSGLVFKLQANMDPRHRDRIAFVRVISGRFTKGMKVKVRCSSVYLAATVNCRSPWSALIQLFHDPAMFLQCFGSQLASGLHSVPWCQIST